MVAIYTPTLFQPQNVNGVPLAGAKLYFYQTGTTTAFTVYQDDDLTTPHANPVVADASGIFAPIYIGTQTAFKTLLTTSADVTVQTVDPVFVTPQTPLVTVDNTVPRFNGTAGALQTSLVTIDDSGGLDAVSLTGAGKPLTVQTFTASGTWTKPADCVRAIFEAVGGGGGGGGVDGQGAGTAGGGGGGSSGYYARTGVIDVSGTVSAAVSIGVAGSAGTAGANNGGAGGNTTITIGATTYTWGGGLGGVGATAAAGVKFGSLAGSATGTNVTGAGGRGQAGFSSGTDTSANGGEGGGTQLGQGGFPPRLIASGATAGDAASVGYGGGGSGACATEVATNVAGGAGAAGYMRVWEFY